MKKLAALLGMCISISINAQYVGIGTTTPTAKLQINQGSSSALGLKLLDSANNRSGTVRFQNLNNTTGIYMSGYFESIYNRDQYLDIMSDTAFIATFRGNGYMGIRNGAPMYPLDVYGDINTNAALRANGNAGTSGQVLQSNGDGTMAWKDICSYKNKATFLTTPGSPWVVPAGVTKVMIEVWGSGGGATAYGGGGGGGYIRAWLDVTPGDNFTITIGTGGSGGITSANNGISTTVLTPVGTFTGSGGSGSNYSAPQIQVGGGGGFNFPIGFSSYFGIRGQNGYPQQFEFFQSGATTFYETVHSGKGGDAGNFEKNGGTGATLVYNITTAAVARYTLNDVGKPPGGGGGPGYNIVSAGGALGGGSGANGMVTIHY